MEYLWDYLLIICTIWFMITFILGRIRWSRGTKGKSKSEEQFERYDLDKNNTHWY